MKVKCLDCGFEFDITNEEIYEDELGTFTMCPQCESSFDIDISVEILEREMKDIRDKYNNDDELDNSNDCERYYKLQSIRNDLEEREGDSNA